MTESFNKALIHIFYLHKKLIDTWKKMGEKFLRLKEGEKLYR